MIIRDGQSPQGRVIPSPVSIVDLADWDMERAPQWRAQLTATFANAQKGARSEVKPPTVGQRFLLTTCPVCLTTSKRSWPIGKKQPQATYCGPKCRGKARRMRIARPQHPETFQITCAWCKETVERAWPAKGAPQGLYCSKFCKSKTRREKMVNPPMIFNCGWCKVEVVAVRRGRRKWRRWCSQTCSNRWWRANNRPPKPKKALMIPECHPNRPYYASTKCKSCYQHDQYIRLKAKHA